MSTTEEFAFNARQYFDFSKEPDDFNEDSFFDNVHADNPQPPSQTEKKTMAAAVTEQELSDTESDCLFYSPHESEPPAVFLKNKMRRSLSLNHLPKDEPEATLDQAMDHPNLQNEEKKVFRSTHSLNTKAKTSSHDNLNRLAKPKRFTSSENLNKEGMTLAEAVNNFQNRTPKRFHSRVSPKVDRYVPKPWGGTKAHTPNLMTTKRARPANAVSREEKERLEIEEARKFKIKANPVSQRVLKGPLKTVVDKKPVTAIEPFKLTEIKKKDYIEEIKIPVFKAQPLPKALYNQEKTKQQSIKLQNTACVKKNEPQKAIKSNVATKPFKPTWTEPVPFSFEKRDQQIQKKKEEYINKVLEEERKAREFHAKPPPKSVLRARNRSLDQISEADSTKTSKATSEENETRFKARPATVLAVKPFEPKRDEAHTLIVQPFQLSTEERLEARHEFDQRIREKEEMIEAQKRQKEEMLKKLEEEERARIRKEAEVKAQPIKKYKPVIIQSANKVTDPVSPQFHTSRMKNKENIPK